MWWFNWTYRVIKTKYPLQTSLLDICMYVYIYNIYNDDAIILKIVFSYIYLHLSQVYLFYQMSGVLYRSSQISTECPSSCDVMHQTPPVQNPALIFPRLPHYSHLMSGHIKRVSPAWPHPPLPAALARAGGWLSLRAGRSRCRIGSGCRQTAGL